MWRPKKIGQSPPPGGAVETRRSKTLKDRATEWLGHRYGRRHNRFFRVRFLVQIFFALASILVGAQLARFYLAALAGNTPLPARPPGVEAFLPISGIMGILDWLYQGTLNPIHPAATILVLLALALALLLRKSFCAWVCPVGFLSEALARFGEWSFGRNFRLWRWLDIPLRSLKYLLLAFFLSAIVTMSAEALQAFILSPYNRVAEVKMGLFFVDLSRTGTMVLGILVLFSVFVEGAWCRYLCPYGALLGLFSWFSPTRVSRNLQTCVSCGLCDKGCPARLSVSRSRAVRSPECTGCMDCIAVCPVPGSLELKTVGRRRVSPLTMAGAVLGLFLAAYLGAQASGAWMNQITDREYVERLRDIHSGAYVHPGGN